MAALLETTDTDYTVAAAKFIAESTGQDGEAAAATAATLLAEERVPELLISLLPSAGKLIGTATEKDAEAVLSFLAAATQKCPPDAAAVLAADLTAAIVSDTQDNTALRLRLVGVVLSFAQTMESKYNTLLHLLNYALATNHADQLASSVRHAERWVKLLELSDEEAAPLLLRCSQVLEAAGGHNKEAFALLLKHLALGDGSGSYNEAAARAVLEFIRAPDLFQSDLLEMKAVKKLETEPQYSAVHRLLVVFTRGQLADLQAFLTSKQGEQLLSSELGSKLDPAAMEQKIRILTIVSLALAARNNEVSYAALQKALQVPEDDVEEWVVKALGAKALDAKLDQLRQVVMVSRAPSRAFGPEQWRDLQRKLSAWKTKLLPVVQTVQAAYEQQVQGSALAEAQVFEQPPQEMEGYA